MEVRKKMTVYFLLAYFFSWIVFVPLALNKQGVIFLFPHDAEHARTLDAWHAFGGFGPFLSAIFTLLFFDGKNGVRFFFNSYKQNLSLTGWLLAFSPILLFSLGILASRIINGQWLSVAGFLRNNNLLYGPDFLMWFFPLVSYGFGEEGGWRGFALPHLQSRYSAMRATLILTIFWLGWHFPSFFYRYELSGGMLIGFILGLFAGAILLTFLFNYTKGSLLAVSLWHFTFNLVSMIGTEAVVAATMSTILMIVAVFVVIKYGGENLSPYPRTIPAMGNINPN
jgi:uncharacterized protein